MMRNLLAVGCSFVLVGALLPLGVGAAAAAPLPAEAVVATSVLQPALLDRFVQPENAIEPVVPDVAYLANGVRVEVYSSGGDNDEKWDWRPVSEFAYLISTVPKGKRVHATLYNSLQDGTYPQENKVSGKWELFSDSAHKKPLTKDVYAPTRAFLDLVNQYDTSAERKKYIKVIGNKSSVNESEKAGSGLANLIKQATDYKDCKIGLGACLTGWTGGSTQENMMHSKYAAFEQAKDSEGNLWDNVVWITSANLNGASGGKKSNFSIALFGDAGSYDAIVNTIFKAKWDNAGKSESQVTLPAAYKTMMTKGAKSTDPAITLYPSPRGTSEKSVKDFEGDFLASSLNAKLGGSKSKCKAYLVHSLFNNARQVVLDNLAKLKGEGCSVKIVLGNNALADIVSAYFSMSSSARQVIDRVEFANVHDKTLTLSYTLNGEQFGTTFGGSANLNGTSLRFDELSFRADDLTMTRAAEAQGERLYRLARGGKKTIAVDSVALTPKTTATIAEGKTLKLKATIKPADATLKTVSWSSSDPAIASVDSNGLVAGVSQGEATITVRTLSGAKTTSVKITVVDPDGTTTDPDFSTDPTLTINAPPVLSMPVWQPLGGTTDMVITWGQDGIDLAGKITLQYYSKGKWHNYKNLTIGKTGFLATSYKVKSSKTWRLKATSVTGPVKAKLASTAVYSAPLRHLLVQPTKATKKPKLVTTTYVPTGAKAPFLLVWDRPGTATIQLQYKKGSKWISYNKPGLTYAKRKTMAISATVTKATKTWRVWSKNGVSNTVTVPVK